MSDIEQTKLAIIPEIHSALDYCRQEIVFPNGLNLEALWAAWAKEQEQRLTSPGARTDFVELCQAGCVPRVLASTIAIVRFAPELNGWWYETLGNIKKGQKLISSLEEAAMALKNFYTSGKAPENSKTPDLTLPGFLSPHGLAEQIESHREMVMSFGELASRLEVKSFQHIARYLLMGYVLRATGEPHDRNISGILGEIVGPADYDEVAQRMWRNRNYERLEQHLSMLPDLLLCLSLAVSDRT